MSGQAPDAKAWAEYHARQAAARAWAQSQAGATSAPDPRVLPQHVDPGFVGAQQAALAQTTHLTAAWQQYHTQQAVVANHEAWRAYYAMNPGAAAADGVAGMGQQNYGLYPGTHATHHPTQPNLISHQHQHQHQHHVTHQHMTPTPSAHHGPVSHHAPSIGATLGVRLCKNPPIAAAAVTNAARGGAAPSYAAATSNTNAQSNAHTSQWPPALKAYVERCFASCRSHEPSRPFVTEQLKQLIAECTKTGTLWTADWDAKAPPRVGPGLNPGLAPVAPQLNAHSNAHSDQIISVVPKLVYGRPRTTAAYVLPDAEIWGGDEWGSTPNTPRSGGKKGGGKNPLKENPGVATGKKHAKRRLEGLVSETDLAPPGELVKRSKRTGRFGDGTAEGASEAATVAAAQRRERLSTLRFVSSSSPNIFGQSGDVAEHNDGIDLDRRESVWDEFTVRGTCQVLEKSYFRLTSAPDPKTVRPASVLKKALLRLQSDQITLDEKNYNYHYLNDQLKAQRQDLVVQRLRDTLTVEVYEHHARVALRNDDLNEFNQCQTVLRELYKELNGDLGKKTSKRKGCENEYEFLAYRVLYGAVTRATGPEFVAVLGEAAAVASGTKIVAHALAARRALAETNVCEWFQLLGAASIEKNNLKDAGKLMNVATEEIRWAHLNSVAKAFRPHVPVSFLAKSLGFTGGKDAGGLNGDAVELRVILQEATETEISTCTDWLAAHGAVLVTEDGVLQMDGKASSSTLFVPEDTNAVAHGDQTLNIDDFLKAEMRE